MTGLGDVAYTGPPDATETTLSPTNARSYVILIYDTSDVTLDGLTITSNRDLSCLTGVYMIAEHSPLTNIKVTNCVIRHLLQPSGILDVYGLSLNGFSYSITDTEISYNEIRDLKSEALGARGLSSNCYNDHGQSIHASVLNTAFLNIQADSS